MQEDFVEVYSKTTGGKQMVPPHFVDHPVLGKDFKLTDAGREVMGQVAASPSLAWTREELDDHAKGMGIDSTGLANKGDVLAAIGAGPQSSPETGSTGPGVGAIGAGDHHHDDPAAGDEE